MKPDVAVAVADRPEASRYEITVGGDRAGFVSYRLEPGVIVFPHTEIDPAFEGRGLGSRLVAQALDDALARGLAVRPQCPFVTAFIESHPDYAELVAPPDRARLGFGSDQVTDAGEVAKDVHVPGSDAHTHG